MPEETNSPRRLVEIDPTFDVRIDTPPGEDPDAKSPTLRRYHQLLWTKRLPDGRQLKVSDKPTRLAGGWYLYATVDGDPETERGWSSDSILITHTRYQRMAALRATIPQNVKDEFVTIGYTICGFMLWPQRRIGGAHTINMAKGMKSSTIADRMDLTLECIRRFYLDPEDSTPLAPTFRLYPEFFELFGDFRGYVDFWLFQDFVSDDYANVKFFLPFDEFETPYARDAEGWEAFRVNTVACFEGRRRRMIEFADHGFLA